MDVPLDLASVVSLTDGHKDVIMLSTIQKNHTDLINLTIHYPETDAIFSNCKQNWTFASDTISRRC